MQTNVYQRTWEKYEQLYAKQAPTRAVRALAIHLISRGWKHDEKAAQTILNYMIHVEQFMENLVKGTARAIIEAEAYTAMYEYRVYLESLELEQLDKEIASMTKTMREQGYDV